MSLESQNGWTSHHTHHHHHHQHHHVPDMHEVKLAIETLSKRSKEGRYPPPSAAHLPAQPHNYHAIVAQRSVAPNLGE